MTSKTCRKCGLSKLADSFEPRRAVGKSCRQAARQERHAIANSDQSASVTVEELRGPSSAPVSITIRPIKMRVIASSAKMFSDAILKCLG